MKFTFKNFLKTHHGTINIILLSKSFRDTPDRDVFTNEEDYLNSYVEWSKETNKEFDVNIDLHHSEQSLNDFKELIPYYDYEITMWDLFEKNGNVILEIYLD